MEESSTSLADFTPPKTPKNSVEFEVLYFKKGHGNTSDHIDPERNFERGEYYDYTEPYNGFISTSLVIFHHLDFFRDNITKIREILNGPPHNQTTTTMTALQAWQFVLQLAIQVLGKSKPASTNDLRREIVQERLKHLLKSGVIKVATVVKVAQELIKNLVSVEKQVEALVITATKVFKGKTYFYG